MKAVKRLLVVVATFALILASVVIPSAKAEASDAVTWRVIYDVNSSRWFETTDGVNFSYATLGKVAAGDKIVIDADGQDVALLELTVYQPVSEIAFKGKAKAAVTAPSVDYAYALEGATAIVNCNVKKVEAYEGTVVQINGNVEEFKAYYDNGANPVFAVTGTVAKANVKFTGNILANTTTMYNVEAGQFKSYFDGVVRLEEKYYSLTAPEAVATPVAETPQAGVLDDVPNTGAFEFSTALIFLLLSVVFAVGAVFYRKKLH